MDEINVQPTGDVSQETPSGEAEIPEAVIKEPPKPEPAQTQPSAEEILKQKIDEAIAPLKSEVEKAKREIQSTKDRALAEAERARKALQRAQWAESTIEGIRQNVGDLDPDVQAKIELAELRAKDKSYQTAEQEEQSRQQMNAFIQTFNSQMNQFITDAGIDPNDKRIDWGQDAKDYFDVQRRILASVNTIRRENVKMEQDNRVKEIKDLEAKFEAKYAQTRKDLGLDSVDTSTPVGGGTNEDKWLADYGDGKYNSPADHKKAKELLHKINQGG